MAARLCRHAPCGRWLQLRRPQSSRRGLVDDRGDKLRGNILATTRRYLLHPDSPNTVAKSGLKAIHVLFISTGAIALLALSNRHSEICYRELTWRVAAAGQSPVISFAPADSTCIGYLA